MFAAQPIARRLALDFDVPRLVAALGQQKEEWWERHAGPYHDGNWESISIWAPNGNLREQRSYGGPYGKTIAALVSPYFWEVAERFQAAKNRVRLLRLRAGGHIHRHRDPLEEIAPDLVRLHVPICTNPDVEFRVDGVRIAMQPGEAWHVDVRFPHEVRNGGNDSWVHLVLDLARSAPVERLLAEAEPAGHGRLLGYHAQSLLPRRVGRLLGL